ncbi:ATP-binding protein [Rheinheimera muenzenbergensis]|uniref:ATP-binding protein n=1 Tax=Rheinheimera muenzenbergensis TaxID=1193628 RepID=A0ABU8CDH5_9GAMM
MNIQDCASLMRSLRLKGMAEGCESLCYPVGEVGKDVIDTIAFLLECEQSHREQRHLSNGLKKAKIPYPHAHQSHVQYTGFRAVNEHEIKALFRGYWYENQHCIIIEGEERSGKTYIASALLVGAIEATKKVRYLTFDEVVEDLALTRIQQSLRELHQSYLQYEVICIDNWGCKPITPLVASLILDLLGDLVGSVSLIVAARDYVLLPFTQLNMRKAQSAIINSLLNRSHCVSLLPIAPPKNMQHTH